MKIPTLTHTYMNTHTTHARDRAEINGPGRPVTGGDKWQRQWDGM